MSVQAPAWAACGEERGDCYKMIFLSTVLLALLLFALGGGGWAGDTHSSWHQRQVQLPFEPPSYVTSCTISSWWWDGHWVERAVHPVLVNFHLCADGAKLHPLPQATCLWSMAVEGYSFGCLAMSWTEMWLKGWSRSWWMEDFWWPTLYTKKCVLMSNEEEQKHNCVFLLKP